MKKLFVLVALVVIASLLVAVRRGRAPRRAAGCTSRLPRPQRRLQAGRPTSP